MNSFETSRANPYEPTRAEIELRAHQLWCQQGCPHGHDVDNWIEAERQLREEYAGVTAPSIPVKEDVPALDARGLSTRMSDSPHAPLAGRAPLATKVEEALIEPGRPEPRRSKTSVEL